MEDNRTFLQIADEFLTELSIQEFDPTFRAE